MAVTKIKRGFVTVRIYSEPTGNYPAWVIYYRVHGKRVRIKRANFAEARREAEEIASKLASGEAGGLKLTSQQSSEYNRAMFAIEGTGRSLEHAATEYAWAHGQLGGTDLRTVVLDWVKRNTSADNRMTSELVEEFLMEKRKAGLSREYLHGITYRLRTFSKAFNTRLSAVRADTVTEWMDSLKLAAAQSWNNYRSCLMTLAEWAKAKRYIPSDWSEIEQVMRKKDEAGTIDIFTPDEIRKLLTATVESRLGTTVPTLAIGAFAGLRTAEIQRLDWSAVNLKERHITVGKDISKKGNRRIVPISDNLAAWLGNGGKGMVCPWKNTAKKFGEIAAAAGVAWKHNALRHSFISYRMAQIKNANQVAYEAGNSPKEVHESYMELVTPKQAEEWWSVFPNSSTK